MTILQYPKHFSENSKKDAVRSLVADARGGLDFMVLLFGSILIATGAIFTDSIPVLIASMIIAPLATPILAMGLGVVTRSIKVFVRAFGLLLLSMAIALAVAGVLAYFFDEDAVKDTYISFSGNKAIAFAIAVVAGYVGAYGVLSKRVAGAVTGVAIAVSLMPPLVATSIHAVSGDSGLAFDAFWLLMLNIGGIFLASLVAFWQFGVRRKHLPR